MTPLLLDRMAYLRAIRGAHYLVETDPDRVFRLAQRNGFNLKLPSKNFNTRLLYIPIVFGSARHWTRMQPVWAM